MALQNLIAVNQTASPIIIKTLGITIPASGQLELTDETTGAGLNFDEVLYNKELLVEIDAGNVVLNNGVEDIESEAVVGITQGGLSIEDKAKLDGIDAYATYNPDTDSLSEGSTNLWYTETRVSANSDVSAAAAHASVTSGNPHNLDATDVGAAALTDFNNHTAASNPHGTTAADVGAIPTSEKGANNGVATLDGSGKIPSTQMPFGTLVFVGGWDAYNNTPDLTTYNGEAGEWFLVTVAGNTNLSGETDWQVNDYAIHTGATGGFIKEDHSDLVASVNGQTGVVNLDTDDINEGSTNLYYTEVRVSANSDVAANTTHRNQTNNPHSVTPAQVGNTTAQWNADQLQGRDVATDAPTDGEALIWNNSLSQWEPGSAGSAGTVGWFSAYDSTGGTDVTSGWTDIPLGVERKKTSEFSHTNPNATVTINEASTYLILGEVTTDGGGRADSEGRLVLNGTPVAGTICTMYNRNTSQGTTTGSFSTVLDLSIGDVLKIQAQKKSGSGSILLYPNGSRLTIVKIKGEKGDQGPSGSAEISVENNGTPVPNGPHDTINFQGLVSSADAGSGEATLTLFGANFQQVEKTAYEGNTTTSFAQYLRLTTASLPAGTYRIGWRYCWSHDSASNDFIGRVQLDDTTELMDPRHLQEPNDNLGTGNGGTDQRHYLSSFRHVVLTSGVHTVDIDYTTNSGGDESSIHSAGIEIWRVA